MNTSIPNEDLDAILSLLTETWDLVNNVLTTEWMPWGNPEPGSEAHEVDSLADQMIEDDVYGEYPVPSILLNIQHIQETIMKYKK